MNYFLLRSTHILTTIIALFLLVSCQKEPQYVESYVISKDGLYGLIDKSGNEIVKPRFLNIEPIQKDGVALAVIDTIYTSVRDSSILGIRNLPVLNIKYGYITSEDKFLFAKPSYAKIKIDGYMDSVQAYSRFCNEASFYGGMAVTQDTLTMLYGYLGINGDTIISAKYRTANRFNQGRAAVQLAYSNGNKSSGKWGLIDPNGENVCEFVFNFIETPVNGRAIASIMTVDKQEAGTIDGEIELDENGKAYINKSKSFEVEASNEPTFSNTIFLVDENGKIIKENLDMMYQYSNFSKDGVAVAIPNRLAEIFGRGYRFMSKDGEFIEPLTVNNITEEQAEKLIESKHFLNELLPEDIEFVDATRFTDGFAAVNLGKAWIFVDKQLIPRGNEENPIYENALPFSHGLAGVKLDGKFGYINKEFNIVLPCKYDSCAIAGKSLCRVYGGRKTDNGYSIVSYVDRNGNVVWQNVNYEGNYWDKDELPKNQQWRDFDYKYIGKNYTPIIIIFIVIAILISIIIISKKHKKHPASNRVSSIKIEGKYETKSNTESKSVLLESRNTVTGEMTDSNRNSAKPKDMPTKPSIDERLNDFLKL
ncbi:MAG: WG repeat-containing protein [Muribaculum sp.]|nr:WG repeat-containing protein [Muribaculum sp.]